VACRDGRWCKKTPSARISNDGGLGGCINGVVRTKEKKMRAYLCMPTLVSLKGGGGFQATEGMVAVIEVSCIK
jgi:hypothetical protein